MFLVCHYVALFAFFQGNRHDEVNPKSGFMMLYEHSLAVQMLLDSIKIHPNALISLCFPRMFLVFLMISLIFVCSSLYVFIIVHIVHCFLLLLFPRLFPQFPTMFHYFSLWFTYSSLVFTSFHYCSLNFHLLSLVFIGF